MSAFTLTAILLLAIFVRSNAYWSYGNMDQWSDKSHYCGGKSQSPIDLVFNISNYDRRLRPLHLEEKPSHHGKLINNGHTAQINMKNCFVLKHIALEGEDYIVEQVHFHWGDTDNINGSEHLLEGQTYPLEMHIVSFSSGFTDIVSAMSTTRGLAVIGLFFEITVKSNPLLEPLIAGLANVRHKGDETNVSKDFDLKALIGEERLRRYYRYDGSLTTPPCYESVIWTVLHEPIHLSRKQLNAFRSLHDEQKALLTNTFRPVQPLGTRKLFRSFLLEDVADERKQRLSLGTNHASVNSVHHELLLILNSLLVVMV